MPDINHDTMPSLFSLNAKDYEVELPNWLMWWAAYDGIPRDENEHPYEWAWRFHLINPWRPDEKAAPVSDLTVEQRVYAALLRIQTLMNGLNSRDNSVELAAMRAYDAERIVVQDQLRSQAAQAERLHRWIKAVETIAEMAKTSADSNSLCSEYDEFVEEVYESLPIGVDDLWRDKAARYETRMVDVKVSITHDVVVTVEAKMRDGETVDDEEVKEAIEDAVVGLEIEGYDTASGTLGRWEIID